MAGVGHVRRTCKDAFSVAGAVQETCLPEMLGGPGADFLRGVAFWSIRSSVLGRWFCVTGAARASKAMSWTTSDNFVLERKKCFFRRNPRRTKLLFRAGKTLIFHFWSDPSKGFAPEIYFRNIKNYILQQFRTLPSSSWHCVMSSPTRPLADAVTFFLNTFDLEMCFAPQWRALFRHVNFQKWSDTEVFCAFWLGNVLRATMACTFSTSQLPKAVCALWLPYVLRATMACTFSTSPLPKVVRALCVLCILTSMCASRHNRVHFFDMSTSKSGPTLRCFMHFDLEMCFTPQWRALFRNLNFQKRSEHCVFCAFWLPYVLRATTACNFSSLMWPHGSAPAALASLFFESFRPSGATNHWEKTRCFATFLPFCAPGSSFFWGFLFFDLLSSSLLWLFPSLLFICPYCRKFDF